MEVLIEYGERTVALSHQLKLENVWSSNRALRAGQAFPDTLCTHRWGLGTDILSAHSPGRPVPLSAVQKRNFRGNKKNRRQAKIYNKPDFVCCESSRFAPGGSCLQATNAPQRVWRSTSGTVCSRDAAPELTRTYSQRVPGVDRQTQPLSLRFPQTHTAKLNFNPPVRRFVSAHPALLRPAPPHRQVADTPACFIAQSAHTRFILIDARVSRRAR